jgi:hypothetical protein
MIVDLERLPTKYLALSLSEHGTEIMICSIDKDIKIERAGLSWWLCHGRVYSICNYSLSAPARDWTSTAGFSAWWPTILSSYRWHSMIILEGTYLVD